MGGARFDLGALSQNGRLMLSENCAVALIPFASPNGNQEGARSKGLDSVGYCRLGCYRSLVVMYLQIVKLEVVVVDTDAEAAPSLATGPPPVFAVAARTVSSLQRNRSGLPFSMVPLFRRTSRFFARGRTLRPVVSLVMVQARNEKIDPASVIPDHFGDDLAVADIHSAAPPASGLLPYVFVPANHVPPR
ncbi:MAG: hypothetical protein ACLQBA_24355 [Candidatus Binataceae bacterium]